MHPRAAVPSGRLDQGPGPSALAPTLAGACHRPGPLSEKPPPTFPLAPRMKSDLEMPRQSPLPELFLHNQPASRHHHPAPPTSHPQAGAGGRAQPEIHISSGPTQMVAGGRSRSRSREGVGGSIVLAKKSFMLPSFIHSATTGHWVFRSETNPVPIV